MFRLKSLLLPRAVMIGSLLTVLLVGLWSCGKDKKLTGPDDPEVPNDPKDTTPPSVLATAPIAGAAGVEVTSAVIVTFSEAIDVSTITAAAFKLDNNVTGTVTVDDSRKIVKLMPAGNLAYSTTYTATVTSGIKDMAGNAMKDVYTWKFTTRAPLAPAMNFPLTLGKRWLYRAETSVGYTSYQGSGGNKFVGDYILYVHDDHVSWQGKDAAQLLLFKIASDGEFEASDIYLSQGPAGLERWNGARWNRLLSTQASSFSNGAFLFAPGPANEPTIRLSSAQITVPAGIFGTLKAEHHYKLTGQYAPHDIFENSAEHYADGVGPVSSSWRFSDDDNDPGRADYYANGKVDLKYVDSSLIPEIFRESEPNHAVFSPALQDLRLSSITIGDAALNDASQIYNYAEVHETKNGAKIIHDWYRLSLTASKAVTVNLTFDGSGNDLDVYLFKDVNYPDPSRSTIAFVAKSTDEPGRPEKITKTLTAGVYILGIQAWDTPGGRTKYWLRLR